MIKGTTQLLGVIGHPIAHSLSPVMHNAAIANLGVDYVYLPFAIASADLQTALQGFAAINLQGFSVTIPHKQAIIPLLNQISDVAQAIGAVNTVCRTETGWYGTNTDAAGFLAPLERLDRSWQNATAVILGNGGAARAVVAGCAQLGCQQIQVVGRDPEKLQAFLESWTTSPIAVNLSVHAWETVADLLPEANLLVNTTPIGMHPHLEASPLSATEVEKITANTVVYDLIYSPRPTLFLQQAQRQAAMAIDGLEMLVQQGAIALQLWLNQPVPVDVMRQALLDYLQRDRVT